jgi:hypothetical protein
LTATRTEFSYDETMALSARELKPAGFSTTDQPATHPVGMHHLRTNVHEVQKRTSARAANDLVLAGVRDVEADAVAHSNTPTAPRMGSLIFTYPQEKTLTIDTGAIFRPLFHRARV